MQSETLAHEFARLVKEYHEGDDHTKPEAWNLIADFAVDNADAISDALSDKQAGEVKGEDAWLGLSTVSSEDLQEALDLLPSVLRPSMSNRIVAAITEQASIINRFKRTSRARRLSFEAARSALVDVPAIEPTIPTANCCVCGRIIDTREISQGGDNFGAETAPGKWTCSMQCDDVVTGYVPDAPSRPEDAKADQYWSTVEQLANCEDEISRLREILTRAEEYVIDGVTTAKAEAEMNAPYPARAPRYDAALAEVRQLYADIRAALAATRSGSATEPSGNGGGK